MRVCADKLRIGNPATRTRMRAEDPHAGCGPHAATE
jgi:hypothetical protein